MLAMSRDRLTTFLGWYLTCCAAYEIGLHLWHGRALVTPRFGMASLLATLLRPPYSSLTVMDWVSGVWLLALAGTCFLNRPLLKAYIASEILLSLPTAYWIISLLLAGGADMYRRADAFILLTILLFFSAVPLSLAICILRRGGPHQPILPTMPTATC